ncbi:MAG: hypothetical protein KDE27_24060 [Planctomycetes bacterium]|nr:hypothetical protein [Planctomycetota bacterium]
MIRTAMTLATTLSLVLSLLPQGETRRAPAIDWQRTLADALAVQQATGKPLLIAVNMDGEVFNDRFRTNTYRDPAFIESTRGWVCVVASPDRHTERDQDSLGNRIECPAFPGCTCGEHIAIEPLLFAKYFGGNRNAPRHVGVGKDGAILFDRFLDRSMQTAIDAIAEHRGDPAVHPAPTALAELAARRDAASRRALEVRYRGSHEAAILDAAVAANNAPFGLVRLALHSDDGDEFRRGVQALIATATPDALLDLEFALARAPELRESIVTEIGRLAQEDEWAARLHAHLTGSAPPFGGPWQNSWREPDYEIWQLAPIEGELDACERALKSDDDAATRLRFAIAQLAFAKHLIATGGKNAEFWLEDARGSARRVTAQDGEHAAEAAAVLAVASFLRGDFEAARTAADEAITAAANAREPSAWLATRFFETLAELDTRAAYERAQDPKAVLQPEIARTAAALQMLAASRWTEEAPLLTGIGLLEYAGRRAEARALLDGAVRRFPASASVHERWRARALADLGTEAMRRAAGELADAAADHATGEWFAGYAAIVAAEQHVRDDRQELATAAYGECVDRFARSVEANAGFADSANHFAVLALAGRAKLEFENGDRAVAVDDLLRAHGLRAASLTSADGLGRTPESIAQAIKAALATTGGDELAAKLGSIGY